MQQNLSIKVALSALDRLSPSLSAAQKRSAALSTAIKSSQDAIKGLERNAKTYDRLSVAVKKTATQLHDAQTQQAALRDAFGKASERTEEQKKTLDDLRKSIGGLKNQQTAEIAKLKESRDALASLGVKVAYGARATEQITDKTRGYNQQLDAQRSRLDRVTSAQEKYNKTKAAAARIRNAGLKMAATGGGVLWGSMRLMRPGTDFDQAYAETLANAQLSRSDLLASSLRNQAKSLANTTHFSAMEVTQGQNALIAGGMTADKALRATPGTLNMALAGGHGHPDLQMAAGVASGVLDAFQMDAGKADEVADAMTATFTRSKTSIESLGETIKYAGTQAHLTGMTFQETAAAAAMLAKNGIEGSSAGTGLQETLAGLTKDSGGILKTLRIRTVEANGAMRDTRDILGELYAKTRKFDDATQLNIANKLFGESGARSGLILMQTAADGQWKAFLDQINRSQGLAQKTANDMTNTFQGDMIMLHSAWDNLWTTMEEGADAPLRKVVQRITHIIQAVTDWAGKHPHLTAVIVDTTLAVGGLGLAVGTLLTTLSGGMVMLGAGKLALRLAGLGGAARGAAGGVSLLGRSLGVLSGSWQGLRWLLTLGGTLSLIPATVIAIGAGLSWAIVHWWDDLTRFWHNLSGALSDAATHGGILKSAFAQFALDCIAPFQSLYNVIDSLVKRTGDWIDSLRGVQKTPQLLQDKVNDFQGDVQAAKLPGILKGKADLLLGDRDAMLHPKGADGHAGTPHGTVHWDLGGKGSGADTAAGRIATTDPNKLGDIVFKNPPPWVRINGGYQEPRIAAGTSGGGLLADLKQVVVSSVSAMLPASGGHEAPATVGTSVAGDMNVVFHIHDARDPQAVAKAVRHELEEINRKNARAARSSYRDRE
ncbi:phage tail tape measure protein [Gibbsiella dentisursi]|uniref:Phage tail tape measure protein n=1 Tax=Gibbsiella dentisursi TaxID=796890 RepID=A0ABP7LZT4_9GAMM